MNENDFNQCESINLDDPETVKRDVQESIRIIKLMLVKYGKMSIAEAEKAIQGLPIDVQSTLSMSLFLHEEPYYWAMDIINGSDFWQRDPSLGSLPTYYRDFTDEYVKWCYAVRKLNPLMYSVLIESQPHLEHQILFNRKERGEDS